MLRAALALDAWVDIEVPERGDWIGGLLVGALLLQEGVTANHLACLYRGAQKIPRDRSASSRLPGPPDLVLSRSMMSTSMIQAALNL